MDAFYEFLFLFTLVAMILIIEHRHHLRDVSLGKCRLMLARSGSWPTDRKHHLEIEPVCQVCGGKEKLEVHHIRPFHLFPRLERDPKNWITLCESGANGINCHLWAGHRGNFKSYNIHVREDVVEMKKYIQSRP